MCAWITDKAGKVKGLRIPAKGGYGKARIYSCSEVIGRFTLEQIRDMRSRLPLVKADQN